MKIIKETDANEKVCWFVGIKIRNDGSSQAPLKIGSSVRFYSDSKDKWFICRVMKICPISCNKDEDWLVGVKTMIASKDMSKRKIITKNAHPRLNMLKNRYDRLKKEKKLRDSESNASKEIELVRKDHIETLENLLQEKNRTIALMDHNMTALKEALSAEIMANQRSSTQPIKERVAEREHVDMQRPKQEAEQHAILQQIAVEAINYKGF